MKIEEQVLNREQMARLEELGVDTSDASMAWVKPRWGLDLYIKDSQHYRTTMALGQVETCCPTYNISDLIEKLPKNIDGGHETYLSITNDQLFWDWCVCYKSKWGAESELFTASNILTALYDCLCWVAENYKELIIK